MISNQEIRRTAREALAGNWGMAVVMVLISTVVSIGFECVNRQLEQSWYIYPVTLVYIVISTILTTALLVYFLKLSRKSRYSISDAFDYGVKNLWPFLKLGILMALKIFAWTLLLIIPGIIAGIRYSQAYFIKIDHPELTSNQVIKRSSELMIGYKWKYFLLMLSFIGWTLLSVLTLGIGLLWVFAYASTAQAEFYNALLRNSESNVEEESTTILT